MPRTNAKTSPRRSGSTDPDLSHIPEGLRHLAVPIDDISPFARNARLHPDANVKAIMASLREFGQRYPLIARTNGKVITAGHGRVMAMQKLGWTHAAVLYIDESEQRAIAFGLADNRTAELAEWDTKLLSQLLDETPPELKPMTGFEMDAIQELHEKYNPPAVVEDEAPAPADKAVSRTGDLWIMGRHRLLCGDSTSHDDVKRLMNGERAVLFATDPPYLVGYTGDDRPKKAKNWSNTYGITWDDADENPELYDKFIDAAVQHAIQPNAAWYCWHASKMHSMVEAMWNKHGAFVHQQIIWAKNRPIITYSWYLWQTEPCLMGWIKGNMPHRVATTPQSNLWSLSSGEDREIKDMTREELERVLMEASDLWKLDTIHPGVDMGHPTPKPVEVFAIPMRRHCNKWDICYEPFSGSGSQISAGEQCKRRVYAMEISPVYVDVAVRRWQALTGLEATHAGTGKTWRQTAKARKVAVDG